MICSNTNRKRKQVSTMIIRYVENGRQELSTVRHTTVLYKIVVCMGRGLRLYTKKNRLQNMINTCFTFILFASLLVNVLVFNGSFMK
jgi:hypothetical protein